MQYNKKHGCMLHVVGNRPKFIKLTPISQEILKRGYTEVIVPK